MAEALTTAEIEAAEVSIIEAIHENPKLTVKAAVERAGFSRTTYYRLRANRKGFAQRIDEAQAAARQAAGDDLEEFLYDRASDPKNPTGVTAGIFLLKGLRPGTYGDRQPRGGTTVSVQITQEQVDLARETSIECGQLEGGPVSSEDRKWLEQRRVQKYGVQARRLTVTAESREQPPTAEDVELEADEAGGWGPVQ